MTTNKIRSTDPKDYQKLPQSIGVMSKNFDAGYIIPLHDHERDQLLYAIRGVMRLRTERESWIVPPDRAVYIPAGLLHSVEMCGNVDMRTLYIKTTETPNPSQVLRVFAVSDLLHELILALSDEPVEYAPESRGNLIAQLIEMELVEIQDLSLQFPLPRDKRLQRVCAGLLADPSDRRTLDQWSDFAGASTRTLARLFESDLGMSFNRWRQYVRFHSALESLTRGDPISIVANQHGYRSTSAFTAAFSKIMGMPPSKVNASR